VVVVVRRPVVVVVVGVKFYPKPKTNNLLGEKNERKE
jgi:hypothetical protein